MPIQSHIRIVKRPSLSSNDFYKFLIFFLWKCVFYVLYFVSYQPWWLSMFSNINEASNEITSTFPKLCLWFTSNCQHNIYCQHSMLNDHATPSPSALLLASFSLITGRVQHHPDCLVEHLF